MRVLMVDTLAICGGAQFSLLELAEQLQKDGHTVLVAMPHGAMSAKLAAAGVPLAPIPAYRERRNPRFLLRHLTRLRATRQLRSIAHRFQPDVIHANSLTAGKIALPLAHAYPLICHVRDLRFPRPALSAVGKDALRLIANSEAVDTNLSEILRGTPRSRLVRVVNGVATQKFTPADQSTARQLCHLPGSGPLITMIAHLVPWKRHDLFIQAAQIVAAAHPDTHFAIVGGATLDEHKAYRKKLYKQIKKLGLSQKIVHFEHCDDVHNILNATDILVHPTPEEPFGRALCEAMALSKAVVAAGGNGASSIVDHGITGLLVAAQAQSLANAVLQLLHDENLRAAMGQAGRQRVIKHFDITRVAQETSAIYQAAITEFKRAALTDADA